MAPRARALLAVVLMGPITWTDVAALAVWCAFLAVALWKR